MAAKAKAAHHHKALAAVDAKPHRSPSKSGQRSHNSTGSTALPPADGASRSPDDLRDADGASVIAAPKVASRPNTTGTLPGSARAGGAKLPAIRAAAAPNPRAKTALGGQRPKPPESVRRSSAADAKSVSHSRKSCSVDSRAEIEIFQRVLFKLADDNHSDTIQFAEFVVLHRALMRLAGDQVENCDLKHLSDEDLERQFRTADSDHNMKLDYDEWVSYLDSVLSILGTRNFLKVCGAVVEEETQKKEETKGRYDQIASSRMLDKVKQATSLFGGEQAVLDCEQLIAKRADPSYADSDGKNSLCFAAEKGDRSCVLMLMDANADPSSATKDLECPVFFAARARNLEVLRLLLLPETAHAPFSDDHLKLSRELVHCMSSLADKQVRELIQKHADVNYKEESGWTALSAAVFWGKKDAVETILRLGNQGFGRHVRIDMQNPKGRSALHIAARKGRVELIPMLVPARADVDLQDGDGWTPLHHATFNGMDAVVEALIQAGASALAIASNGFTPYMMASLPSCSAQLRESTLKLIEPDDSVNFSKKILPILNGASLKTYDKIEALQSLPTVNLNWKNLRLYEQYFHGRIGPNKVRLQKTYECLVQELIRRLRTDETDTDPTGPHLSDEMNAELVDESARRRRDQRNFLKQWFQDTMGPPISRDWHWESRESYRQELEECIQEEVLAYRQRFDDLYAKMKEQDGGEELCSLAADEVLASDYLLQTGAHPILPWLDTMSMPECFEALRCLQVRGMGKDEDESLMSFMDLICMDSDFETGKSFWRNVYKLWLVHYAQMIQTEFHQKVKAICKEFNAACAEQGYSVTFKLPHSKTYSSMKRKEVSLLENCGPDAEVRYLASGILDVVRLSLMPNCPAAAMKLIDEYFRPLAAKDHMSLVRIINGFHPDAHTRFGYRNVVLNVFLEGGIRATPCGRPNQQVHVAHIGEIQIVLAEFVAEKKRVHLIEKFLDGHFDRQRSLNRASLLDDDAMETLAEFTRGRTCGSQPQQGHHGSSSDALDSEVVPRQTI